MAPRPLGLLCHWYKDLQVRYKDLKGSAVQAKNSVKKNNNRRSKEAVKKQISGRTFGGRAAEIKASLTVHF